MDKRFGRRALAVVMAGLMGMGGAPMAALAQQAGPNTPSAGEQTGTGRTDLTMVMERTAEAGGTEDTVNNPDADGDGLGDNIAFTVPSAINYVVKADGTLVGPAAGAAYMENRSAFKIHVSSADVDPESGWSFVADASASAAANSVDLQVGPAADMLQASEYLTKKAVGDASEWNMAAEDGSEGGADRLGMSTEGNVANVAADITQRTKFGEVHWYVTPGEAKAPVPSMTFSASKINSYVSNKSNVETVRFLPNTDVATLTGYRTAADVTEDGATGDLPVMAAQSTDGKTVVITSQADRIKAGTNQSELFSGWSEMSELTGFNELDFSAVTNMDSMFYECESLENVDIDLSRADLSSVRSMYSIIDYANVNSFSLAGQDLTNVEDISIAGATAKQKIDLSGVQVAESGHDGDESVLRIDNVTAPLIDIHDAVINDPFFRITDVNAKTTPTTVNLSNTKLAWKSLGGVMSTTYTDYESETESPLTTFNLHGADLSSLEGEDAGDPTCTMDGTIKPLKFDFSGADLSGVQRIEWRPPSGTFALDLSGADLSSLESLRVEDDYSDYDSLTVSLNHVDAPLLSEISLGKDSPSGNDGNKRYNVSLDGASLPSIESLTGLVKLGDSHTEANVSMRGASLPNCSSLSEPVIVDNTSLYYYSDCLTGITDLSSAEIGTNCDVVSLKHLLTGNRTLTTGGATIGKQGGSIDFSQFAYESSLTSIDTSAIFSGATLAKASSLSRMLYNCFALTSANLTGFDSSDLNTSDTSTSEVVSFDTNDERYRTAGDGWTISVTLPSDSDVIDSRWYKYVTGRPYEEHEYNSSPFEENYLYRFTFNIV